mgnify:CR=1 FL=1
MKCSTLKGEASCWPNQLFAFLLAVLILPAFNTLQAQTCPSPPSVLVNGDFEQPATSIGTSEPGNINNNLTAWRTSHGHPSIAALPPRSVWMWSYKSTGGSQLGEGVYNCFDFQAGQTYVICFDLQTNGKADGATVEVHASNSVTTGNGSTAFPSFTSDQMWSDLTANYSYNNWTEVSFTYTPTSNYSQLWIYPFWSGITRSGTPAPQGNPYQAEMRIDNISINPVLGGGDSCVCDISAAFNYSVTEDSCAIAFTNESSGNCCTQIIGQRWDFGDGTTSTAANPTHTYSGVGSYNVCLTTVGLTADGECCTDSVCYTIDVDCVPCVCDVTADFNYSVDGCQVNFTDASTAPQCNQITGWQWYFGDGTTSNLQNPAHNYGASGSYTACLVTTSSSGTNTCTDSICYNVTVDCPTGDCECDVDLDFDFNVDRCQVDFSEIINTNCQIVAINWDFGDGSSASTSNPTHYYNANGSYTVCLTVTVVDANGVCCDYTICKDIDVDDCPCDCDADADIAFDIEGCNVNFDIAANANCTITDYIWDFGDGNTGIGTPISHTYASNGTYTVCVTVVMQDPAGEECYETFCVTVVITECNEPEFCGREGGGPKGRVSGGNTSSTINSSALPFEPHIYPNPTSDKLFIEFENQEAMDIEIVVYNSAMGTVAELLNDRQEAGVHQLEWNANRSEVTPGTYFIMIKSGDKVKLEKVVIE